ncbi:MAG TPA: hypothetical protein VN629_08960 [Castellaniella sp.]|nr:hypothetical protein [Castellaniella sp.]
MMNVARGWKFSLLAAVVALGLALGLRHALTALMSLHMLVQIPLLVLAGLFAEQAWHRFHAGAASAVGRFAAPSVRWSWNAHGLPGLLLVSLIGACWMIPKALDDALVDWRVAAFKYLGLPVCGWVLRASLRESNVVVKLFFLGNFCWMSAIVGIEYMSEPIRLCNAYLQDDQDWSGRGLIALAIILPSCWLLAELKPIWRFLNR